MAARRLAERSPQEIVHTGPGEGTRSVSPGREHRAQERVRRTLLDRPPAPSEGRAGAAGFTSGFTAGGLGAGAGVLVLGGVLLVMTSSSLSPKVKMIFSMLVPLWIRVTQRSGFFLSTTGSGFTSGFTSGLTSGLTSGGLAATAGGAGGGSTGLAATAG